MKQLFITSVLILLSASCAGGEHNKDDSPDSGRQGEQSTNQFMTKTTTSDQWERLVMRPFKDAKGTIIVEMPFPSSWTFDQRKPPGQPYITGPKGIKVMDYPLQSFVYSPDPQLQQLYWQNGKPMRPFPNSIDELIQQVLYLGAISRDCSLSIIMRYPRLHGSTTGMMTSSSKSLPHKKRSELSEPSGRKRTETHSFC